MTAAFQAEEERIRRAYATRPSDDWRYSWLNPAHVYLQQEQHRAVLALLRAERRSLASLRVLDVGCGSGHWLRQFVDWGLPPAQLTGIDLIEGRIAEARLRCPDGVTLRTATVASIPAPDASFDVALQFTVFTSILDNSLRRAAAVEMLRVLRPGGIVIWYDFHAQSRNPDVRAIGASEIGLLFHGCQVETARLSLAPPLVRALAPRALWLCRALNAVPLLRTHYLATVRKP